MSNDGMKDTDRLAANASDPHQYGDNERHEDYDRAVGGPPARCMYCGSDRLFRDDGAYACEDCGASDMDWSEVDPD